MAKQTIEERIAKHQRQIKRQQEMIEYREGLGYHNHEMNLAQIKMHQTWITKLQAQK